MIREYCLVILVKKVEAHDPVWVGRKPVVLPRILAVLSSALKIHINTASYSSQHNA